MCSGVVAGGYQEGACMRTSSRKGFTLIELLVVMVIIAMLAALLLPAIGDARRHAITTKCMANMHAVGIAILSWGQTTNYQPVEPTSPADALTYFTSVNNGNWVGAFSVHNGMYCWTSTDGSDGPNHARTIVDNLYPNYLPSGEVFYCPSFNRLTKHDFDGSAPSENVNYSNSWKKTETDWWLIRTGRSKATPG